MAPTSRRSGPRAIIAGAILASLVIGGCRDQKAVHYGVPFPAEPAVSLAAIAKDRAAYRGRTVTSAGTVTFVCQEKGCWMEVEDEGIEANVRIHEHAFTFPKNATGKKARFVGVVTFLYEGQPSDDAHLAKAQIEFDTTGAELSP